MQAPVLLSQKKIYASVSVPTTAHILLVSCQTCQAFICRSHSMLLIDAQYYHLCQAMGCLQVDVEREALAKLSASPPENHARPDNMCYIIFTSGSTGRPKGAVLQHAGVINYLHCLTQYASISSR